jgi:hypothetical protein
MVYNDRRLSKVAGVRASARTFRRTLKMTKTPTELFAEVLEAGDPDKADSKRLCGHAGSRPRPRFSQ